MKKKNAILFFTVAVLAIQSCGGGETDAKKEDKDSVVAVKADVNPDMLADLGISGMACEINCVSSVRKKLLSMNGVASMEIDFDATQKVNHAVVKFDKSVVTEDQMVKAIEELNDKQYKVETVDVKPISEGAVNTSGENASAETTETSSIGLIDLYDLFGNLL